LRLPFLESQRIPSIRPGQACQKQFYDVHPSLSLRTFSGATGPRLIEGARNEDGKGPSIWDTYARRATSRTMTPTTSPNDHYHCYKEAVARMSSIGANAYQFSIARPRIFPEATQTKPRPLGLTNSSQGIISYCLCVYFIGVARKQTSKRLAVNLPLKNCPPFDFCPQHRLSKSLTEKSDFNDNCPESTYR
jgi:hypothetical protein